jgi:hypothetical protein
VVFHNVQKEVILLELRFFNNKIIEKMTTHITNTSLFHYRKLELVNASKRVKWNYKRRLRIKIK